MTNLCSTHTKTLNDLLSSLFQGAAVETATDGLAYVNGTSKVLATIRIPIPQDGDEVVGSASLLLRVPHGTERLENYLIALAKALNRSMGAMLRKYDTDKGNETPGDSTQGAPKDSAGSSVSNAIDSETTGFTSAHQLELLTLPQIQKSLRSLETHSFNLTQKVEALEDIVGDLATTRWSR